MKSVLQRIEKSIRSPLYKLATFFVTKKDALLPLDGNAMKRILLIRDDRIGDMVVSLPVIQFLKDSFPHLQIDVLCTPYNVTILQENPNVHEKYLLPKGIVSKLLFFRTLRKNQYDCIIPLILIKKSRYGLFGQLIQTKNTITVGFVDREKEMYSKIFSILSSIPFEQYSMTEILLRWFSLLFGIDYNSKYMFTPLKVPKTNKQFSKEFLRNKNCSEQIIAYNLSASDIRRQLTDETHIRLITLILEAYPHCSIVLLSIAKDQKTVNKLLEHFGNTITVFPATTNIYDTIALIELSKAVISPNTAITHIAASLDKPLLEIYSTLASLEWGPKHTKYRLAKSNGNQFGSNLNANEVFSEFQLLMQGQYLECTQ